MDTFVLVSELERDEGLRLKPYADSLGIQTIGIGRNLRDVGISREEAYALLNHDLERVFADLDHRLSWWRGLDEVRQRVLANMCFNMGIARLLTFANTLALIQSGDFLNAASAMVDSVWAKQVGLRAARLAAMMGSGKTA